MKFDAQYYNEKLLETLRCWRTCSWEDAIDTLKQIARDGAEAQKVADKNAVAKRADEIGGEYGDVLRDQAITAIQSATVEVPGE